MSDDLVKRLWLHDCEGVTREAADRIKELGEELLSATMDGHDRAKNEYRDHIEELESKLTDAIRIGKDWFEEQKKAHVRAVSAEAKLERISDAWADALYSDLENGVGSINARVELEFRQRYPAISSFGAALLDIMLEENT